MEDSADIADIANIVDIKKIILTRVEDSAGRTCVLLDDPTSLGKTIKAFKEPTIFSQYDRGLPEAEVVLMAF